MGTLRYLAHAVFLAALLIASPGIAVQPDEMLDDPALEARAREITKEVRCLVCRNESIDDSHASLARDLRLLVRERIVAGDSDAEVKTFLVDRYGEFVLLKPVFSIANAALWLAGPFLFILGLIASIGYLRRRKVATPEALDADEQAALEELLKR